jgi:hypothetical protein
LLVLGLHAGASAAEIDDARRALAKVSHPDVGGSLAAMQRINAAADRALGMLASPKPGVVSGRDPVRRTDSMHDRRTGRPAVDHPSFVIEALPAESHAALLVVSSWLGEVIDDDPPYALEVLLAEPLAGWCRLVLVPDAGGSTISIAVDSDGRLPAPDITQVRDAWVAALNQLDWAAFDQHG